MKGTLLVPCVTPRMKPDLPLGLGRLGEHLLENLFNQDDLLVVPLDRFGQLRELLDQFARRGHQAAQADERPHDPVLDRSTLESIATPCSVKTQGRVRRPPYPELDIAFCDIKFVTSCCVS